MQKHKHAGKLNAQNRNNHRIMKKCRTRQKHIKERHTNKQGNNHAIKQTNNQTTTTKKCQKQNKTNQTKQSKSNTNKTNNTTQITKQTQTKHNK